MKQLRAEVTNAMERWQLARTEIVALRAENERLAEALGECAECLERTAPAQGRARQAATKARALLGRLPERGSK